MEKRQGPRLTIAADCYGCAHEESVSYCVEDGNDVDSGHDVYCKHPEAQEVKGDVVQTRRRIGDTTWETPAWCPLLPAARAALLAGVAS